MDSSRNIMFSSNALNDKEKIKAIYVLDNFNELYKKIKYIQQGDNLIDNSILQEFHLKSGLLQQPQPIKKPQKQQNITNLPDKNHENHKQVIDKQGIDNIFKDASSNNNIFNDINCALGDFGNRDTYNTNFFDFQEF